MKNRNQKTIAIVGMGRFGQTLYRLLRGSFQIFVWDNNPSVRKGLRVGRGDVVAKTETEIFRASTIFYAVPISAFQKTLKSHKRHLRREHLLVDVLSVKVHPARVFRDVLGAHGARVLLTHPMFGPDSAKPGFMGLPIVTNKFTATPKEYAFWKQFFKKKGLKIIELTPDAHDRLAANSQGVTHFIGRLLRDFGFKSTPIDTTGAKKLQELQEQVCNDTPELFRDLQTYNPYTKDMRVKLGRSYAKLYKRLLPHKAGLGATTIGIQGGRGSFSEQALLKYVRQKHIRNYSVKYLFTSERVLRALNLGAIDLGLFAMQNALGGVVKESVAALAKHNCRIIAEVPLLVRHSLMRRKDNLLQSPRTIMAHDQVFAQCGRTIAKRYPKARLLTGKGDMVDTARAAGALASGEIPKDTFILGPESLAALYDLEIVARDLQDDRENYTTFLLVGRR